jgi:protein phosphatase PTC6
LYSETDQDWAYIVLVSDGVSSVVSDDEVVDLARDAADPRQAADRILAFAEEMGSEDNATAIVVPLAGWGKIQGPDKTKTLREYRQRQAGQVCFTCYTFDHLIFVQLELNDNVECEGSPSRGSLTDNCITRRSYS